MNGHCWRSRNETPFLNYPRGSITVLQTRTQYLNVAEAYPASTRFCLIAGASAALWLLVGSTVAAIL